jgi:hypothetical protein
MILLKLHMISVRILPPLAHEHEAHLFLNSGSREGLAHRRWPLHVGLRKYPGIGIT